MAKYVRSTDGNNADDGSTWALAEADLHTTTWTAGDTIYVSQAHAQSTAANIAITTSGTLASPTKIICANDAAEPPTAVATTGSVTTTGAATINVHGCAYTYGLVFNVGTGFNNSGIILANYGAVGNVHQTYESCAFNLIATGSACCIYVGGSAAANANENRVHWRNCTAKFAAVTQYITVFCEFVWEGGSITSGGTSPTSLLSGSNGPGRQARAKISGVDLSNLGTSVNIFGAREGADFEIRNCKLPASWNGSLVTGTKLVGGRYAMYNCDSGDTNYRLWVEDYAGSIVHDSGIYNDAGASDGTTRISWKMVSGANAEFPVILLRSPEIVKWNDTTGSAITCTVEIVHNSQGSGTNGVLNDDECWLEVMYLGTAGYPLGTWITDCKADVLATAAAQDTSSAAWTGDSSGWDTQKLAVTFTPQEKGFIHARIVVAKASATVYVDPLITVT